MTMPTRILLAIACSLTALPAVGQPPEPPPPAKYKATLRYYIPAPRDQHVMQYDAMIVHLKKLKFDFDPPYDKLPETNREDRSQNYIAGWITPANKRKLLDHPATQTVLLVPDGFDLPKEPADPVMVRLELATNLSPDRQRELVNQTRVLLGELGF